MKIIKKLAIILIVLILTLLFCRSLSFASSNDLCYNFNLSEKRVSSDCSIATIYPGVEGSIIFKIDNDLSHKVTYSLSFLDENQKPDNLYFMYNGTRYENLKDINSVLKDKKLGASGNETITIRYIWEYETGKDKNEIFENDKIDTKNQDQTFNFKFLLNSEGPNDPLPRTGSEKDYKSIRFIIALILLDLCYILNIMERRRKDESK